MGNLQKRIEKLEQAAGAEDGPRYYFFQLDTTTGDQEWQLDGQRLECAPELRPCDFVTRFISNVALDAV